MSNSSNEYEIIITHNKVNISSTDNQVALSGLFFPMYDYDGTNYIRRSTPGESDIVLKCQFLKKDADITVSQVPP